MPKKPTRLAAALAATIDGLSTASIVTESERLIGKKGPTRIMYIECKAGELVSAARIGRVTFSKTWKTVYYQGRAFQRIPGVASSRITTTRKPKKIIGFQVPRKTVATGFMAKDSLLKLMRTFAKNIGAKSETDRIESMNKLPSSMENAYRSLVDVLCDARVLLARNGNDFAWSSWRDEAEALREIGSLLTNLEADKLPPKLDLTVLFAPTGPIQEVSLSSGWSKEFLSLAERFDRALAEAESCQIASIKKPRKT